jgi:hypothetical protein
MPSLQIAADGERVEHLYHASRAVKALPRGAQRVSSALPLSSDRHPCVPMNV